MLHKTIILCLVFALVLLGAGSWGQSGAPPANAGSVPLEGTYWRLIEIGGMAVGGANENGANLILNAQGNKLDGSTGCNKLIGSYKLREGALRFKLGKLTKTACPGALGKQEEAFVEILKETQNYRIVGETLELRDKEDLLARFQAQPQQRP